MSFGDDWNLNSRTKIKQVWRCCDFNNFYEIAKLKMGLFSGSTKAFATKNDNLGV